MLRFIALGPMEVQNDFCTLAIKGVLQQTLLATFLTSNERLLTADELIEELWGTTPPARTENALHAQISRLRRTLAQMEADREDSRLVRATSGYQLKLDHAEFDGATLRDTIRALQAREGQYTRQDVVTLRSVLELWRGPVFGGISGGPICQRAVVNYHEYRTGAQILLYELEMTMGEYAKVIPELSALVEEFPFQESFCGLLMVALYHSGRQADALAVARDLRNRLASELGIDPRPRLRDLEKAILNHDQRLLDEAALFSRSGTAGMADTAEGQPHAKNRSTRLHAPRVPWIPGRVTQAMPLIMRA